MLRHRHLWRRRRPAARDGLGDIDWATSAGGSVRRFNLAQEPLAFAENETVCSFLHAVGQEGLPVTMVDGATVLTGRDPSRPRWAGLGAPAAEDRPSLLSAAQPAESADGCCGGGARGLLPRDNTIASAEPAAEVPTSGPAAPAHRDSSTDVGHLGAAGVAVALAERDFAVHLTTTNPAAHLTDTLAGELANLEVSRIDPAVEIERYSEHVLATKGAHLDRQGLAMLR
nr:arsenic metallochaperone ArsD family protein [Cryobacterium adonitolivorans]